MSQTDLSSEIFEAEPFTTLVEASPPEDVLKTARELGQASVSFAIAVNSLRDLRTEFQDGESDSGESPSSQAVEALVDRGLLTREEVDVLRKVSKDVVAILFKDDEDGDSQLATEYARCAAVKGAGRRQRARAGKNLANSSVLQWFDIADRVSDKGKMLLSDGSNNLLSDSLESKTGVPSVLEPDIDVLRVCLLTDLITYAKSLPEEVLAQANSKGRERGVTVAVHVLIAGLRNKEKFIEGLKELFSEAPRSFITRRLKGRNQVVFQQGIKLWEPWRVIRDYTQHRLERRRLQLDSQAEKLEEQTQQARLADDKFNLARIKLLESTQGHVENEPSSESMFAALAVERWIEHVYENLRLDGYSKRRKPVRYRSLHDAIDQTDQEAKLIQLEQAISTLEAEVDALERPYDISSSMIRNLEKGLSLRHLVEKWTEPGSNRTLFDQDQAQQLAGIALLVSQMQISPEQLYQDVTNLRRTWSDLAYLRGSKPTASLGRRGLLRTLDTLAEWHETAPATLLAERQLRPIWNLARILNPELSVTQEPEQASDSEDDSQAMSEELELEVKKRELWRIPQEFASMEDIVSFPPGTTGDQIVRELAEMTRDSSPDLVSSINWERIFSLIELRDELQEQGFSVDTCRLKPVSWHPLPRFVVEIQGPNKRVAIVESPVYANATYIIADDDWRTIVQFERDEQRTEFGAIPKVHEAHTSAVHHRQKLFNTAISVS